MMKKKEEPIDYEKIAQQLAEENASLNDALLRERADAMNVRKRAEEDRVKMGGFYKVMVVKEFLSSIDNLDRALKSQESRVKSQDSDDFQKGIVSIHKQLLSTLAKLGVERIKTVGEHFDPELHEAVTMEEGDGEHEIVSEELQSGYKIDDDVIRHALVKVTSK